ncbi:MAG: hypothetical protein A3D94_01120 [Alphaproteobacteria bacterium RIFCSPHIGHO2_12_FULL_66_14]|jgi:hypothetical protein|nr:MAG: hypothetical protein A3D94_01120 [Alphaproteobacteria bacterium RIFCSPHIGHO2_12_FULL_66_14]
MPTKQDYTGRDYTGQDLTGLSELEREVELEMDDELEIADDEAGDEGTLELESGDDEAPFQVDPEFEAGDGRDQEFVDRFLEIASRQFESEFEVDQALNEVLEDVAQEYLFGSIWKKAKRFGRKLANNRALGALVRKGLSVASGQLPALKAAMQLAKGNLKGALLNLGKQAIGAAIPGGSVALGALSALRGGGPGEAPDEHETWQNYTQIAREAFEHLGNTVNEMADQPIEASRLAANAFQHAVGRAQARAARNGGGARPDGPGRTGGGPQRVSHHRLRRGEKLIISGAGTIIVRGG